MAKTANNTKKKAASRLVTPTDLSGNSGAGNRRCAERPGGGCLCALLQDQEFPLARLGGPHFRDYHLLFDDQASEISPPSTIWRNGCARLAPAPSIRSARSPGRQTIKDNDKPFVSPAEMLRELMADTKSVIKAMRAAHEVADRHGDVATASILENFIDAAEKRTWFLFEASRSASGGGH